jgi:hypothetical protein
LLCSSGLLCCGCHHCCGQRFAGAEAPHAAVAPGAVEGWGGVGCERWQECAEGWPLVFGRTALKVSWKLGLIRSALPTACNTGHDNRVATGSAASLGCNPNSCNGQRCKGQRRGMQQSQTMRGTWSLLQLGCATHICQHDLTTSSKQ